MSCHDMIDKTMEIYCSWFWRSKKWNQAELNGLPWLIFKQLIVLKVGSFIQFCKAKTNPENNGGRKVMLLAVVALELQINGRNFRVCDQVGWKSLYGTWVLVWNFFWVALIGSTDLKLGIKPLFLSGPLSTSKAAQTSWSRNAALDDLATPC